jgi:hypothetical protein
MSQVVSGGSAFLPSRLWLGVWTCSCVCGDAPAHALRHAARRCWPSARFIWLADSLFSEASLGCSFGCEVILTVFSSALVLCSAHAVMCPADRAVKGQFYLVLNLACCVVSGVWYSQLTRFLCMCAESNDEEARARLKRKREEQKPGSSSRAVEIACPSVGVGRSASLLVLPFRTFPG